MHMTFLPSTQAGMASMTNLREEPQEKSRTLSALKIQIFFALFFFVSEALASARLTISTGSFAVCACCQRANCPGVSTCW